jgi:membrane protease YdiL (CAAX protease family)
VFLPSALSNVFHSLVCVFHTFALFTMGLRFVFSETNQSPYKLNHNLFWQRLPVLVRSVIIGTLMAAAGTLPWALLVELNLRYAVAVPWAIIPTAIYLWFYWRFAKGISGPASTKTTRAVLSRANRLSGEVMSMALFTGTIALGALVLSLNVMNRMVRLPSHPTDELSSVPVFTLILWLIMSAIVAGVTEEISFRGYMQGPIERRHGPVVAMLVTGLLFGAAHFTHDEVTIALLPFYMAVAIIYGTLAYLTNSVLPGILLHAGGNMLAAINLFGRGQAEWQTTTTPAPLIWETGVDAAFWFASLIALIMITVAIMAYRSLAKLVRSEQEPGIAG